MVLAEIMNTARTLAVLRGRMEQFVRHHGVKSTRAPAAAALTHARTHARARAVLCGSMRRHLEVGGERAVSGCCDLLCALARDADVTYKLVQGGIVLARGPRAAHTR
jgi:hypothetical protein